MQKALTMALATVLGSTAMVATAGPDAGDNSFTVSGSGSSDDNFDSNNYGVSLEWGRYATDDLLWGIRQSVNGQGGDDLNNQWNGSTRGFVDYHFLDNEFRPYVGANIGGIYGEGVKNTGTAGLEVGIRYYVRDKTFINFGAEYAFLFDDGDDIDNRFDDGAYFYTLGVGYNF